MSLYVIFNAGIGPGIGLLGHLKEVATTAADGPQPRTLAMCYRWSPLTPSYIALIILYKNTCTYYAYS